MRFLWVLLASILLAGPALAADGDPYLVGASDTDKGAFRDVHFIICDAKVAAEECDEFNLTTTSRVTGQRGTPSSYTIQIILIDPTCGATPDFQVLYDDDLANDETDASRRFST